MSTQHSVSAREAASNTKAGEIPESISSFNQLPDSALIRGEVVRVLVGGITDVTHWRWIKSGRFPKPIKLPGGRINAWRVGDVRNFLERGGDHAAA